MQSRYRRRGATPPSNGNLLEPIGDGWQVSGGWQQRSARPLARAVGGLAMLVACAMLVVRSIDRHGTGRRHGR